MAAQKSNTLPWAPQSGAKQRNILFSRLTEKYPSGERQTWRAW
jgi:hypothetical protein